MNTAHRDFWLDCFKLSVLMVQSSILQNDWTSLERRKLLMSSFYTEAERTKIFEVDFLIDIEKEVIYNFTQKQNKETV